MVGRLPTCNTFWLKIGDLHLTRADFAITDAVFAMKRFVCWLANVDFALTNTVCWLTNAEFSLTNADFHPQFAKSLPTNAVCKGKIGH